MHVSQLAMTLPPCFHCSAVIEQMPGAQPLLWEFRVTPNSAAIIEATELPVYLFHCAVHLDNQPLLHGPMEEDGQVDN